jgi:uncharacterized protein (TIGR02117 family)
LAFKKIIETIARILLGFVAFIALYFLAAFILPWISVPAEPGAVNDVTIFIQTNGVHAEIAVPVKNEQIDWSREVLYENTAGRDTSAGLISFGWGDKGFYLQTPTWAQLKFNVAFKAVSGLSTSAIHATFYTQLQQNASCKKILISKQQYARLVAFISRSFKTGTDGHLMYIKTNANYGSSDAFYDANRRYNLFYTCNTWVNDALKSCGQKACLWTPFDFPIFRKYR